MLIDLIASAALAVQAAPMVTARDPAAFMSAMAARGYETQALETVDGIPLALARRDGIATVVAFGGCEGGRMCSYVVLTANWDDMTDIPLAWLNDVNSRFDLVTASRSDDRMVVRMGVVLGRDGVPGSTFDMILDQWQDGNAAVVEAAAAAGLVPE